MNLQPQETDLVGKWERVDDQVVNDSTTLRIRELVKTKLVRLVHDASGWDVLFRDPNDGRLWELTYPHSELHGGGPPRLTCLTPDEAQQKYNVNLSRTNIADL